MVVVSERKRAIQHRVTVSCVWQDVNDLQRLTEI